MYWHDCMSVIFLHMFMYNNFLQRVLMHILPLALRDMLEDLLLDLRILYVQVYKYTCVVLVLLFLHDPNSQV